VVEVSSVGWVPNVTVSLRVEDPRRTVSATVAPGAWSAIAETRSLGPVTAAPSMAVTTSPARRPASSAGPPGATCWTRAPATVFVVAVLTPR
jgi:hypothetical protein